MSRPKPNIQLIRQACKEVIESKTAKPLEKIKAAELLAKVNDSRELARERRRGININNGLRRPGRPKAPKPAVYEGTEGLHGILAQAHDNTGVSNQSNAND